MDDPSRRRTEALTLLTEFAARTALGAAPAPERYLWTDAFAVCTLVGLGHATGEPNHTELALRLVDQVHRVLGRHRPDDRRVGWISGLDDAAGAAHPTAGGLRIGKPPPERPADAPLDDQLEWERDGQYFHYLTKWMHALDQVTRATGQPMFARWARELADAAHRAFTHAPGPGEKRLYWKMSIDGSRPLVASMGQHDALDGLVTCLQLETSGVGDQPSLRQAIADYAAMVEPQRLATADPLGLGGLLADAYRLRQLEEHTGHAYPLVALLLEAALPGLRQYRSQPDLHLAASRRLAFRELGLAIGLAALERAAWRHAAGAARTAVERLSPYLPLRRQIEAFWRQPQHRATTSWLDHANINDVMLAASLAPDGFLTLRPARAPPPVSQP